MPLVPAASPPSPARRNRPTSRLVVAPARPEATGERATAATGAGRARTARRAGPPRRIGILGGVFDPPHRGHIALARAAYTSLGLQKIMLVVAPSPPHKAAISASFADRLAMTRLLARGQRWIEVSDIEARLAPPQYTVRTIEALARELGEGTDLVLILGADNLADLPHWKDPQRLALACRIAAFSRPTHPLAKIEIPAWLAGRVQLVEGLCEDVSSSELRQMLARGVEPPEIAKPVLRYIRERGLYR